MPKETVIYTPEGLNAVGLLALRHLHIKDPNEAAEMLNDLGEMLKHAAEHVKELQPGDILTYDGEQFSFKRPD